MENKNTGKSKVVEFERPGWHKERDALLKHIDFIFQSGNAQIISTMKMNIAAYRACIEKE